ncbi:MAG: hypothetical protein OJF47_000848 [Nitrospira sp.]|nr:MAG: hypothetical protein OJF47_000848 [Nitrospira sp.]
MREVVVNEAVDRTPANDSPQPFGKLTAHRNHLENRRGFFRKLDIPGASYP